MIKLLKFLLPLCVFLLGGYVQHFDTHQEFFRNFGSENSEMAALNGCFTTLNGQGFVIKSDTTDNERGAGIHHRIDIEVKENELTSARKYFGFSNDLNVFYTHISGSFIHYIKVSLLSCKHFYHFPSYKSLFLLFGVMRI
jgi:hypothetical protein